MAVKKFFGADGVLHEIELPDVPFTGFGNNVRTPEMLLGIDKDNPTGVDPTLLPVDAAQVDNLIPTPGAYPTPKFPDPLPGSGEGAGIGQKSGSVLRDAWNNNPSRQTETVESVQSGPVGSAAAVSASVEADAPRPISPRATQEDADLAADLDALQSDMAKEPVVEPSPPAEKDLGELA